MRKLVLVALAALAVPTASLAQFQVGARLGYHLSGGDAAKDEKMSDGVKSQVPIQVDAAYKFTKELALGGYFSYGFGQLGSQACPAGASCSASDIRVGIQGFFTFADLKAPLVPWLGLGIGYERGNYEAKAGSAKATLTYSGWEYLNLQVGGDMKVSETFSFGPYVMFSVAQYGKVKVDNNVVPSLNFDGSIPSDQKAMHQWFGFGVRGKFDL
jgi:hypothetical protein